MARPGGFAAGLRFIIPGALVMFALSVTYALFGAVPLVAALFFALKSAVLVLVVEALPRLSRRALKGRLAWTLAAVALVALFFFAVPFPIVILGAGVVGYMAPSYFSGTGYGRVNDGPPALLDAVIESNPGRGVRLARSARNAGLASLAAWLAPVALLLSIGGTYSDIAWFFSKIAVATFGGAYAVLAYAAQEAVSKYHWLSAPEMLAGLGLAETTSGLLILVLQFVGFLAGYRAPDPYTGLAGRFTASVLTLWVTFASCFAFVFLGAPLIERLQNNRALSGALAAITAGVVGVIANLAVWFALHALFYETVPIRSAFMSFDAPIQTSLDPRALLFWSSLPPHCFIGSWAYSERWQYARWKALGCI